MSDDGDRFAALDAADSGPTEPDDDAGSDGLEAEPEPERMTETKPDAPTEDSSDKTIDDPAFSYNESDQGPIYARPETWDSYDDALELDVEKYLREQGIRNAQKRELHDAALRLAVEYPEELAELLIQARRSE